MDGVFLSAQIPYLRNHILGSRCSKIGVPIPNGYGLVFGDNMLVLTARPDSPGLWWTAHREMTEPVSPVWSHHLEGGEVKEISQQGSDRMLCILFASGLLYGSKDVKLIFEATGRNANVILMRMSDNRILACHRRISSSKCRYRTVAPGQVYKPPPGSGLQPGSWCDSSILRNELSADGVTAETIYKSLEGVGPVTARALIRHASDTGLSVFESVKILEQALLNEDFSPWSGPEGPLPIQLGEGEPIENPLSGELTSRTISLKDDRIDLWTSILHRRRTKLQKRLSNIMNALETLVSPDTFRIWGNLLLSEKNNSRRGLKRILLTDWNGVEHDIPLKLSKSLVENAQRYFRKASNADIEVNNLNEHEIVITKEIITLDASLAEAPSLSIGELNTLLGDYQKKNRKKASRPREHTPFILTGGWRCFAGRNAKDNDEVTFMIGKRGDYWFHARGIPGAHVVLKLDGKVDNPSAEVILEAAVAAARGSGVSSGVVPVDYTRVQYVSRIRKGKPGQVIYKREKTIFVDLDRLPEKNKF
ncbi:MAG: NFACT family protein [Candidatus Aegiribacteria sp.]|nr:NFACT family protein [Candidatus Aegiribacteria sp.]